MSSIYYDKRHTRWCLDTKIEGRRLFTSCRELQPLERMDAIIKNNHMTYYKAKSLMTEFKQNKITHYVGHQYLYSEPAYRIILGYKNGDGFICKHFHTLEDAYNDERIQARIVEIGNLRGFDFGDCIASLKSTGIWRISYMVILYCRISKNGNIRPIK